MKSLMNNKYILNPNYLMRGDKNRVVIIYLDDSKSSSILHPMHAIMLSFFKGNKVLMESIQEISDFFMISKDAATNVIAPFIENIKTASIEYDNHVFKLPENLLIKNENNIYRDDLNLERIADIEQPYDFKSLRLSIPKSALFVINTNCLTDCIYCYADRKTKYTKLPLNRIFSLIEEAKSMGISKFELSGGEVLLYENWLPVIEKLHSCGYNPEISTKIPVSRQVADKLESIGIMNFQISLDSLNPELTKETLGVNQDYTQKMLDSLRYLNKRGFKLTIKPTLSRMTCTIENLDQIINVIKGFNNIEKMTVTIMGYSHYKSIDVFHATRPTLKQVEVLSEYVQNLKLPFPINLDDQSVRQDEYSNYKEFKNRSLCSGNVDGIIILPDGKVTICEELYWNQDFIIGDLSHQSIIEVWQSDKAINLWRLSQDMVPADSPCKTCQDFDKCRQGLGVCWKEVIAVYGGNNIFYPDPRCPLAPTPIYDVKYNN